MSLMHLLFLILCLRFLSEPTSKPMKPVQLLSVMPQTRIPIKVYNSSRNSLKSGPFISVKQASCRLDSTRGNSM